MSALGTMCDIFRTTSSIDFHRWSLIINVNYRDLYDLLSLSLLLGIFKMSVPSARHCLNSCFDRLVVCVHHMLAPIRCRRIFLGPCCFPPLYRYTHIQRERERRSWLLVASYADAAVLCHAVTAAWLISLHWEQLFELLQSEMGNCLGIVPVVVPLQTDLSCKTYRFSWCKTQICESVKST